MTLLLWRLFNVSQVIVKEIMNILACLQDAFLCSLTIIALIYLTTALITVKVWISVVTLGVILTAKKAIEIERWRVPCFILINFLIFLFHLYSKIIIIFFFSSSSPAVQIFYKSFHNPLSFQQLLSFQRIFIVIRFGKIASHKYFVIIWLEFGLIYLILQSKSSILHIIHSFGIGL